MATVTLPFNYKINVSLQPGDIVYYYTGGTLTSLNDLIKIGKGNHYPITRIINSKVDTTFILGIN